MKANPALTVDEILNLNAVYTDQQVNSLPLNAATVRGKVGLRTASTRPAVVSTLPIAGDPLSPRDSLYVKTEAALNCSDPNTSAAAIVAAVIQSLPEPEKGAFAHTPLDVNLCLMKAFYADLQRPAVVQSVGSYEKYKEVVGQSIEQLAKECREYVAEASKNSTTMETGLSAADLETAQAFNHTRRVIGSLFNVPIEDGEVYLDSDLKESTSLDDSEKGGMNRVFSGLSYSGSQRPLFMKYMPYYLMTMHSPMFKQALSRPRQLSAVTSRPGPLKLPPVYAARYGVPPNTPVTYRSVSRYGESQQRGNADDKKVGSTMKYYYTYEENGVTKVLALPKNEHFKVQLDNRNELVLPAGTLHNVPHDTKGKYVHCQYNAGTRAYNYDVDMGNGKTSRYSLTQAAHMKVLQHNAALVDMNDPNAPVHLTHMADGSLDSVMNRIFNELSTRAVSNKSSMEAYKQLIPANHRERMKLMKDMTNVIRPSFEAEQRRIETLRAAMFKEFADKKLQKDVIENTCRTEAVKGFRQIVAMHRRQMPADIGRKQIGEAVGVIDDLFEELYKSKANEFAKVGAARMLYARKTEPFYSILKDHMAKTKGFLDVTRALEDVSPEARGAFGAAVDKVSERMEEPGGLKDQLAATYWGGVTQCLVDLYYGPEGIISGGNYVGRDNLPKNGKEFQEFLGKNAKELFSDSVQVANRLRKTFAYYAYHVAPFYKLPWPNLYRSNDLMRQSREPNQAREARTLKPIEAPVDIIMPVETINAAGQPDTIKVRLTGTKERENTGVRQQAQHRAPANAPAPQLEDVPDMSGF